MKLRFTLLLATLFASLACSSVEAHNFGQSYVYLRVYDSHIEVIPQITAADLDRALGLSLYADEQLTPEEAEQHLDVIRAYVEEHLHFATGGRALPLQFVGFDILDFQRFDFLVLEYRMDDFEEVPTLLDVEYDVLLDIDREHVNLLIIEHNWKTATFNNEANHSLVFTPPDRQQQLDLSASSVMNGFWGLVKLGVWHIWIGIDHILFLLALILPSVLYLEDKQWKPVASFRPAFMNILAIVTFFTLAHSVTLSLAALDIVRLPSKLVESIIAGSIAVAALHNIFPRVSVREWMIAFVFGLFHGFGFASVMGDIGMGQEYMVLSLLGFNLGVELGQIAIIAVVFPILYLIRTQRWYIPVVLRLGSVLLILISVKWIIERLAGMTIGWMFYLLRQKYGF